MCPFAGVITLPIATGSRVSLSHYLIFTEIKPNDYFLAQQEGLHDIGNIDVELRRRLGPDRENGLAQLTNLHCQGGQETFKKRDAKLVWVILCPPSHLICRRHLLSRP